MKLSYSKKILTFSLVVFFIVLTLNIVFINLLLNKIVNINDKVKQLELSSAERLKEITLKDSVLSSKEEREVFSAYFVPAGDAATVDFTKELENLAFEFGVDQQKTLSYEPLPGRESSDTLSTIKYKFNVTGKWSGVYSFLRAVENLQKVSHLNSVSLSLNFNPAVSGEIKAPGNIWSADLDFFVVKLK